MRWRTTIVIAAMAAAVGGASAGTATAATTCVADSLQSTCETLDNCSVIGVLALSEPPTDAVAFYRTCLFTDHSFRLATTAGAGTVARSRGSRRPAIYASTFWPLYCEALRRAGQSDASICNRRVHGTATKPTRHRTRRHRLPSFTG